MKTILHMLNSHTSLSLIHYILFCLSLPTACDLR